MIDWSIDTTSDITLSNLMSKHELYCASTLMISSFGMAYFVGYAAGSVILPNLSDKKGRKNYFLGAMIFHLIALIAINFLP